ncbi:MAG: hypothetical protein V3U03_16790 [Myxococcota bacterium]
MSRRLRGWPLVGWAALAIGAICAAILTGVGSGEDGLRIAIRATARTSLLLFSAAFTASSLAQLWPSAASRWLLRNRRYLGVSFGVSHSYHALMIASLALLLGDDFETGTQGLIFGGFAYVLLALMVATSFDRSAGWLGPLRWRRLHRFGAYYIWFIFAVTLLPRTLNSPLYAFFSGVVLGASGLRVAARLRQRRPVAEAA